MMSKVHAEQVLVGSALLINAQATPKYLLVAETHIRHSYSVSRRLCSV